jgi:hypothetical protein
LKIKIIGLNKLPMTNAYTAASVSTKKIVVIAQAIVFI